MFVALLTLTVWLICLFGFDACDGFVVAVCWFGLSDLCLICVVLTWFRLLF